MPGKKSILEANHGHNSVGDIVEGINSAVNSRLM